MGRYVLGRLSGLVGVLFAVSLLTFVMMHSIPGGPFDTWGGQYAPIIPRELVIELEHRYGLDQPVLVQYWKYLQSLMRFDFGYSFISSGRSINELLAEHWPYTLQLGALTFVLDVALTADRKLAREDAAVVRTNLAAQGFHIQFPPQPDPAARPDA